MIATCAVIVTGLRISSVEVMAQGHDMSNMPGMKMSKPKAHRKTANKKRRVTTRKRRPAKKHQMGNNSGMTMPGMNMPNTQTAPSSRTTPTWRQSTRRPVCSSSASRRGALPDRPVCPGFSAAEDGNEHANAQSITISFAENRDEHAGYANADRIAKAAGFTSTPGAYAHAFCEPFSKSNGSNARHGNGRDEHEYGPADGAVG